MSADWNFDSLEEFIQQRGEDVIHEIAIACPCRKEDAITSLSTSEGHASRQRGLPCEDCQGTGMRYRNAQYIKGMLTQINAGNRRQIDSGYAIPGDCVFSPSLYAPAINDFDKITFTSSEGLDEGQVICRNGSYLSEAKLRNTTLTQNQDRLWYNAECSIWCEDKNGVVYVDGTDFELCSNVITWIGNKPEDGVYYTLKYNCFFEWIAYNGPLNRYDRGRNLAPKVLLRKKHTALLNKTDSATPSQRQEKQLALTGSIKI